MGRSASLGDELSDRTDALGATGRRWWLMAALLASATAEQAEVEAMNMASPALAVKAGRDRGISVLERQRKEEELQQAAAHAAAPKRKKQMPGKPEVQFALADDALPNGVGVMGRGRAVVNAPLRNDGDGVQALQERRQSLMSKADFRPMRAVVSVAPAGAGKFEGMPDRDEYQEGEDGEADWARDLERFAESNFQGKGVELRTIDQHVLKTGFFGCWHEKGGHGEIVRWVELENGWELRMSERDGAPVKNRTIIMCHSCLQMLMLYQCVVCVMKKFV